MSTDPHARIAAAVRAIADAPPVTPPPPGALRDRPARAASRRAAPALAAAAVIAIAAVVALLPSRGTGDPAPGFADGPAAATLPATFAGMSPLTAAVSDAPPGPVIALYGQGSLGTQHLGTSQVLVTGVDGHTYRRLDEAEKSGSDGADGEWHAAPRLLSPGGERVALGDDSTTAARVELVDLSTGRTTSRAVPPSGSVVPVSWSPDGERLLLARSGARPDEESIGKLELLDLATGAVTPAGETTGPMWTGSFSPDGTQVAMPSKSGLSIVGPVRRRLPLGPNQSLVQGPSWSPDGRLLVLSEADGTSVRLAFADATASARPVPPPITVRGDGVPDLLGWRTADTMLVGIDDDGHYEIAEMSIHGGQPRVVSRISHGPAHLARVTRIQLAADLVAGAEVRDTGGADRGPWPIWWRVTVGALVLLAGFVAWRVARRRRYAPSTIVEQAVPDDDTHGKS
ncbi:WD40 repeat domain-containing protein [Phytohabitans sp. LJ34]|uniref:WD40 repeat domain-containing protein n=1 Tax=Phytohabitans sp. LJ34 TaxID=3452217 RepID=UPI003F895D1F